MDTTDEPEGNFPTVETHRGGHDELISLIADLLNFARDMDCEQPTLPRP
jgi:hypothetical protein